MSIWAKLDIRNDKTDIRHQQQTQTFRTKIKTFVDSKVLTEPTTADWVIDGEIKQTDSDEEEEKMDACHFATLQAASQQMILL